jgi:hypothetical protein
MRDEAGQHEHRKHAEMADLTERKTKTGPEGRRSFRVTIAIPVVVYGRGPDARIFYEETSTQVVNAHGGRVTMHAQVARGQEVVLVNRKNGREVSCRVVYYRARGASPHEVGLEFDAPEPRFWGINFPPPDWENAYRKRSDGSPTHPH